MAVTEREKELPSVSDVVESLGCGLAQFRVACLGGCVWLADGAELLLIGSVTRAVSKEWHINALERSSVVSVVFVGILVGNMLAGPLGDAFGRRIPIIVSYAGIAIFSVASTFSQTWTQLSAVRIFVGASFGIGQPAFTALCSEVTPSYWRLAMNAFCQSLFAFGEMFSAALIWWDDPQMKNLDWRWLLLMGAIPSVICLLAAQVLLHDSPSYLATQGRHDEAKKVLLSMRRDNRAHAQSVEFKPPAPEVKDSTATAIVGPLQIIFSRRMLFSTIAIIYSCFTLNVLFYGCLYAFPQVLTEVDMGPSPAMSLLVGAFWEIPGFILAAVLGMWAPRKPLMMIYLALVTVSLMAFAQGTVLDQKDRVGFFLLQSGYIGIKAFVPIGFVAVYQYASEIYPTVARTTGTAACVAGGRVGGMVAPVFFEVQQDMTGRFDGFFYIMAILCTINFVLVFLLPIESFGKSLEEIQESLPLTSKQQSNRSPR